MRVVMIALTPTRLRPAPLRATRAGSAVLATPATTEDAP
jgi:hypothetical protein